MRKFLLLPILLVLVCCAYAQETGSPYKEKTLSNGLEVYVVENHGEPIITVDITARNGSFTEPEANAGLSHLYEHMFFKGNDSYPDAVQCDDRMNELGNLGDAYTTEEYVSYFFIIPSANIDSGMAFMAAAIKTPKFDEKELEQEREVVLGEFDRDEARPTFKLEYALDSAQWGNNVVRKQPLGQRPTIKKATREQMVTIQHRFYIPNNCALIISGDIDADEAFALAQKYLGDWKRRDQPFPKYDPPAFASMKKELVEREAKIPDVQIELRYRGPSVGWGNSPGDDKATYAADVLSTIINMKTSHFQHILVDSGAALSANASYYTQHNVGPVTFYLEAKPETAKKAIAAVESEIKNMASPDYYTEDALESAKQSLITQRLYSEEDVPAFAMQTLAAAWGVTGMEYYLHYLDNVKKITRQDLADYVKKYLEQNYLLGVGASDETLKQLALDPKEVLQ